MKLTRLQWFVAGLIGALSFGAFAVTGGGFPSRPTFQAVTVTASSGAGLIITKATTVGASGYAQDSVVNGTANAGLCTAQTANVCGAGMGANDSDLFTLTGSTLHIGPSTGVSGSDFISANATTVSFPNATTIAAPNATTVPWPVQTTGSFTSTLSTGCTTTPTATLTWVKTGNVVTLSSRGTGPAYTNCTSNSADRLTDASLPAAIRPAVNLTAGTVTVNDNSVNVTGCMWVLATGSLRWGRVPAAGTQCGPPNMTTSGTTGLDNFTVSYLIN